MNHHQQAHHLNVAHLGLLALVVGWAALTTHWSMAPLPVMVGGLVLTVAWLMAWERWQPYRGDWLPSAADLRRDVSFLGANAVADGLADGLVWAAAVAAAQAWPGRTGPAQDWPLAWGVLVALLLSELGDYALHRASHRGGWLWRLHRVHHRQRAVNASNNVTTHPVNVLLRKLVRLAPLWPLGFSAEALLWAGLLAQAQSFAVHANTAGRMGWLNYVIGSAELHRWHHSVRPEQALNFGSVLPLWDQVFGSFRYRPAEAVDGVGLADDGATAQPPLAARPTAPPPRAARAPATHPAHTAPGLAARQIRARCAVCRCRPV